MLDIFVIILLTIELYLSAGDNFLLLFIDNTLPSAVGEVVSTLNVTGKTLIQGDTTFTSTLNVSGNETVDGNLTINGQGNTINAPAVASSQFVGLSDSSTLNLKNTTLIAGTLSWSSVFVIPLLNLENVTFKGGTKNNPNYFFNTQIFTNHDTSVLTNVSINQKVAFDMPKCRVRLFGVLSDFFGLVTNNSLINGWAVAGTPATLPTVDPAAASTASPRSIRNSSTARGSLAP